MLFVAPILSSDCSFWNSAFAAVSVTTHARSIDSKIQSSRGGDAPTRARDAETHVSTTVKLLEGINSLLLGPDGKVNSSRLAFALLLGSII
jgi:hypothetical protein